MVAEKVAVTARSHPDSIYAGAIGAAEPVRHERLNELQKSPPLRLAAAAQH